MGITFINNNKSTESSEHPYLSYPIRFRRIFNNFMMSKTGDDMTDSMNWSLDMRLYGMHGVFEKLNLQLPSFVMAKQVYLQYGHAPEQ